MAENDHTQIPLKRCPKCDVKKPATPEYFTRHRQTKDGLNSHCKTCSYARRKAWDETHKEYSSEKAKIYRRQNLDELRIKRHEYSVNNREKERQAALEWQAKNPEKVREANKRYQDRKHTAADSDLPFDKAIQLKAQSGKCFYCGVQLGDQYHIDHKIPLIRGGSDHPDNKVITCPACNLSKRDKTPEEFAEWRKLVGAD